MPGTGIAPTETTVPLLPCVDPDATLAFWRMLGFRTTWEQSKPYLYLAFEWSGIAIHYGRASASLDPAEENSGGCLVLVDDVAAYHAAFAAAMRAEHGKVLSSGRPRIARYRAGASRFTLTDPSGNAIIVVQRDAPEEVDYGSAPGLAGLAKALDTARIFRDFKRDDLAAWRALSSGLRRHADGATPAEHGRALAALIELAVPVGAPDRIPEFGTQLAALDLSADDRAAVRAEVAEPATLDPWLR